MEATGHYWLALYTHLWQQWYLVHVINAVQSDALRGMYIRQAKNDSWDSFIIAEVIRFGRFCETSVSTPDLHALRELCRHRFWIVDSISDLKRKVIALLDQVFPKYEKLFAKTFGKTSLQLLSEYTTPEELLAVDMDKLAQTIYTSSHGRHGLQKAQKIKDAAHNSFGILLASDSIALCSFDSTSNRSVLWNHRSMPLTLRLPVCSLTSTISSQPLPVLVQLCQQ